MGQPPGLPEVCQGSPRWRPDCHLLSWKPNVEGFAGRAESTQVCGGSQPGHPPRGRLGLPGPKNWDAAACKGLRLSGFLTSWPASRLESRQRL